MSQIWVCECGNQWRAAGNIRTCPTCGSPKVKAVVEASIPGGFTSVLPGNAAGNTSDETVAQASLVKEEISSETLAGPPSGLSDSVSEVAQGAEVTLDRSMLTSPPTGAPNAAPTVQPATEILLRSGARETNPRSPAEPSYATIATPPSTGGGGDTHQTVGGGASTVKKRVARPRSRMEDYEILGVLGRGGMGVVHKARHIKLDRLVALKMILAGSHAGEAQLARFQTEAEAVAQLQHPNIVQIYDIGEHNGAPFIALEFVDGGSLQQKLDGTPMPPRIAAELVATLARAVDYAHQRGVVHRDLKPANILLDGDWTVGVNPKSNGQEKKRKAPDPAHGGSRFGLPVPKITDFGLAKRTDEEAGQTGTGDILGTPSYMSPEQATGKNEIVGPPADIYSLGAILYDLLTGRPPFKGETVLDTLQQVQGREPLPPTRVQPGVPRDLETICLKCLQKEPSKRYPSAEQLADDLDRFLEYKPIVARPTPWYERVYKWAKRRPAVAALLASLAVTLTGAFIGMFILWRVAEGERLLADEANGEAQTQKKTAEKQRDRADANRDQAFGAAEELLTAIAHDPVMRTAQMESIRKDLLVKAMNFYERFYAVEGDTPQVRDQVARAKRRAGYILEQLGKREQASAALETAIVLFEQLAKEEPSKRKYQYLLAGTRNDYAIVLQTLKDPQAEREYREALRMYSALQRAYPLEVVYQRDMAATYNSYAGLLMHLPGRIEESDANYQQALVWSRKLHDDYPKDRDYQWQLAETLIGIGFSFIARGDLAKAEPFFSESLGLWTSLVSQDRDQPIFLGRRVVALLNLGLIAENKTPAKSEEYYRESISVGEKLVRDFSLTTDYRFNLAMSYTNLSLLLARDKVRIKEAADLRHKAIPHWEKLVDQDPSFAEYRVGLASSLHSEAEYQARLGNKSEAVQWAAKAVKRQEDLVATFPERLEFQVKLARGYTDLGQLYGANGKAEQEQENYQYALNKLEEIKKKSVALPSGWARTMAAVHNELGLVRAQRGDLQDALTWWQKALKHQQESLLETPVDENAQSQLARFAENTVKVQVRLRDFAGAGVTAISVLPFVRALKSNKGEEVYSLAKSAAGGLTITTGDEQKALADQVVQLLQVAVQQGFNNAQALGEPVFSALKGRADYEALLKSVKK